MFVRVVSIFIQSISKVADRGTKQVIHIVGVAVDNLDTCTPASIIMIKVEVDSVVNLALVGCLPESQPVACVPQWKSSTVESTYHFYFMLHLENREGMAQNVHYLGRK